VVPIVNIADTPVVGSLGLVGYPGLRCVPLDDELADQLVTRTLDPADANLRDMTSDMKRFSSRERLDRWNRNRRLLCLVDPSRSLLGVVWVGRKPMPDRDDYFDPELIRLRGPQTTWAIRLYGSARRHGLAAAFSDQALAALSDRPGRLPLWYQTKSDNAAARALGDRLGFLEASGEADGTVVGVRFGD
jgi:hypothetical protein